MSGAEEVYEEPQNGQLGEMVNNGDYDYLGMEVDPWQSSQILLI